MYYSLYWDNALYHHGVKGQKWGIRRYQNPDGSLTPAGKERYRYKDKQLDPVERRLGKIMDKNVRKSERREKFANYFKNQKADDDNQGFAYNFLMKRSKTFADRMVAGSAMLKSYRSMKMDDQRSIDKGVGFFSDGYTMEALQAITIADMYRGKTLYNLSSDERSDYVNKFTNNVRKYR